MPLLQQDGCGQPWFPTVIHGKPHKVDAGLSQLECWSLSSFMNIYYIYWIFISKIFKKFLIKNKLWNMKQTDIYKTNFLLNSNILFRTLLVGKTIDTVLTTVRRRKTHSGKWIPWDTCWASGNLWCVTCAQSVASISPTGFACWVHGGKTSVDFLAVDNSFRQHNSPFFWILSKNEGHHTLMKYFSASSKPMLHTVITMRWVMGMRNHWTKKNHIQLHVVRSGHTRQTKRNLTQQREKRSINSAKIFQPFFFSRFYSLLFV